MCVRVGEGLRRSERLERDVRRNGRGQKIEEGNGKRNRELGRGRTDGM